MRRRLAGICLAALAVLGCSETQDGDGGNGGEPVERAWGEPQRIDSEATVMEVGELAVGASGSAISIWLDWDSAIWAQRYEPGEGWGTPQQLESGGGLPSSAPTPRVAVAVDGTAMLVWLEQQPDAIWARRYTPAGGWASLVRLDRGFEEYTVSAPDVAMDDRGRAIATWRRSSEGGSVVAARFTPESGWSGAERLDEPSSGWGYETRIAMNARGEAIAVWKGDDNTSRRVFANRFTPEAGWGTSGRIDNASDTFIEAPLRVAIDSRGTGIVVWHQESGGDPWISRITANWYVPGAGWEGAAPIEGGDASYSYFPDVAMTPDNVAFVVWLRSGEEGGIFAMRHMPDDGWGEEATVFEYPFTGTDTVPRVAASAAGEALAVWRAFDSEDAVWSSHFAPSSGWDAAVKLNDPFGASTEAQVGMDAEGDGIAVWSQSPASGSFCYASHYVANE